MSRHPFATGDLVWVKKITDESRRHFLSEFYAVLVYSYGERYGNGVPDDEWHVMTTDGFGHAWYHSNDLEPVLADVPELITLLKTAHKTREQEEAQLSWIITNWPRMQKDGSYSGASLETLGHLIGMDNLWGPNGEGFVYDRNARFLIVLFSQALLTGKEEEVHALAELHKRIYPPRNGTCKID